MDNSTRDNERRLEALLECGNDLIAIINAVGIYEYVGPSVKRVLNVEPQTFVGKSLFDYIHPEDCKRIVENLAIILTSNEPVYIQPFRFSGADGNWHWVETYATNKLDDPAVGGIIINSRDITSKIDQQQEKQFVLEKLRLINERYDLAIEATRDIIWDLDIITNEVRRGQTFEKRYNGKSIPRPWENQIHPDDRERVLKSVKAATLDPEVKFWNEEYKFINPDGSISYITDRGYIVRDANERAIRMVGAMHDNTELKERELRILKQNEQLREIAAINSHEIRRPLASILGLLNILDKTSIRDGENARILQYMEISVRELDDVITRIVKTAIE